MQRAWGSRTRKGTDVTGQLPSSQDPWPPVHKTLAAPPQNKGHFHLACPAGEPPWARRSTRTKTSKAAGPRGLNPAPTGTWVTPAGRVKVRDLPVATAASRAGQHPLGRPRSHGPDAAGPSSSSLGPEHHGHSGY